MKSFSSVLLLLQISSSAIAQQCYWPDGSNAQSNYVACNASIATTGSACCAVNDACTTTGFCLGSAGFVYRGGCTDKTWSSAVCQQQYCKLTGPSEFQNLYPCLDGGSTQTFCCNANNDPVGCCASNFTTIGAGFTGSAFMPVFEAEDDLAGITSSTSSSAVPTQTTGSVSTTTVVVVATVTINGTASSTGVPVGGVAGAAVGSAVVGIGIGLLAGLMLWRKSAKTPVAESQGGASMQSMLPSDGEAPPYRWQPWGNSMPKQGPVHEIGQRDVRTELE